MRHFGLIGKSLSHSFSRQYFSQKFEREGIAATYGLFELASISEFPAWIAQMPPFRGLNVTIPYKTDIIPFLSALDPTAAAIGAVNTLLFDSGKTVGYNTDVLGALHSLRLLKVAADTPALVLGTGGAAKAIAAALTQYGIHDVLFASRNPAAVGEIAYAAISPQLVAARRLIINTTPVGMYPAIEAAPDIPYEAISAKHYCWDAIYNPVQTLFLQHAHRRGAATLNGLPMLHEQAEQAWRIWNDNLVMSYEL